MADAYATGPTRDAAVLSHRESHVFLSGEYARMGTEPDQPLTPICGVRHCERWKTNSGWEKRGQSEPLDHDSIINQTVEMN